MPTPLITDTSVTYDESKNMLGIPSLLLIFAFFITIDCSSYR